MARKRKGARRYRNEYLSDPSAMIEDPLLIDEAEEDEEMPAESDASWD